MSRESPEISPAPEMAAGGRSRILYLSSHVVQYSSPLFRRMAQDPRLEILIAYCTLQGATASIDPEFGVEVSWDIPVLEGFPWVEMPNRSPHPGLGRFFGLINPGVWKVIREGAIPADEISTFFARG